MADYTDNPGIDNFSIQDTMSMGTGSQELLNDLLAPETAAGNPNDLTPIIKDVIDTPAPEQPTNQGGKAPVKSTESKEGDTPKPGESIMDFLGKDVEEEEEEEDGIDPLTTPAKLPKPSDTPDDTTGDEPGDEGNTQFSALSRDLLSLGVFTTAEGEQEEPITTPEEFLERFNAEKQKGSIEMVNQFIGQFGEDYQSAFEAIFVKGVDPKEYFNTFNTITDFANLDLAQETNQKAVLRQALHDQGFDQDDIETEIERMTNYGDLESVAQKHHKVLIKKQAAKLEDLERRSERELQNKAAIRNEYVSNVQTIIRDKLKDKAFDGIPLNPTLASELHDFLLVDKYKTPSGETLTDFDRTILELKRPENHATKVKLGLLLKILEKDPTLSTIQKTGITKKANTIFSEVVRQGNKPSPQQQKGAAPSWFK
jgi:hypothetical protein